MLLRDLWDYELFSVADYTLLVNQVCISLIIFIASFVFSAVLRKTLRRLAMQNKYITREQSYIFERLSHYVILVIGALLAISALGINVGKLTLLASALGIGIGLGLQGIVNNFVSGIAILVEKTLKVGDFIELDSGVVGEVMEVNMRATLLRTNDNVDILIPNSELTNGKVINWTLEESVRRFRVPFSVAYGSDKNLVKKAALEAADNVLYTLKVKDREPVVWFTGFGDSSLNFTLGVWVPPEQLKRPTSLFSDYLWAIDDAFRKYDIEIPFPQRDIHIRTSVHKDNQTLD
ncbi:mechanosensitive ion channel family protein [Algibacillus agarilyticus]|uniref:mechanosensitive ion channel family protein n=1 Tax=Algibacillus agarilyticus TaxID=2234133 RepID=UPI000DCFC5B0|nr:mechanosensitive ion channel domain-containing protein [Algibacillus agarilyticus]